MTTETENTSSDNLSYTQAIAELEQLVARLQNPQCEIDKLREYTAREYGDRRFYTMRQPENDLINFNLDDYVMRDKEDI